MEPIQGIEPWSLVYHTSALPLSYIDMVPPERLELSLLSEPDSKSGVSAIPPQGHGLARRI